MHVQHSEQTARDQLVISQLPTDSAQVAQILESMPEQAIVNSTTHDAAQSANSSCSGGGEAQKASAQVAQRPGSQPVVTPSGKSPPGFDPAGIGVVTDSLAQRRSELLLEQNRKRAQVSGGEQKTSAADRAQNTGSWNGAAAPAQREQWSGSPQAVGPVGRQPTEPDGQKPEPMACDPDDEELQRQETPATTNSGLGLERSPATLRVKLRLAMPNGTELSDIDVLVDTGSEPDLVDSNFARLLWQNGVRYGDAGGHLTVVGGGTIQPHGSMRVTVVVAGRDGAKQAFAMPVPRRLEFEIEPQVIDNCPAQLVLGWATLKGTGLIDVLFGTDQFEPESEGMDIGEDMWVDVDKNEFEMPTIKGTKEQQLQFAALVKENLAVFGPIPIDENGEGGSLLPPMDIELKRDADGREMHPKPSVCRPCSPWIADLIKQDTDKRLKSGFYRPGSGPYASPIVAAKQPAKGPDARRICVDYTRLNECAVECRYPVKNQAEVTARLAGSKYFCTLDLRSGYHQLKLTPKASRLMAAITPHGLFEPITAPFGLHGLPAFFQMQMSTLVFNGIETRGVETFIDDIVVHAADFDTLLIRLRDVLERLAKWNLRVNGAKTILGGSECTFLGHTVDGAGHKHTEKRVEALQAMRAPTDKGQLRSFIGCVQYFREHLGMDAAALTKPLTELTKKAVAFSWTAVHQECFEEIKRRILQNQKLAFLDYELPIFVRTDASKLGCGAQLFQVVNGRERTVSYLSKAFTPTEARWSVLEQELFGCFYAVKRWAPMLLGAKFTILTDHKNILQLHKSVVPKIVRWRLQMQPFEYTVKHVPGPENVVADCLSRLHGKSQRAIVSSSAVLLPDGSYAQDGEFEPDRATVELIRSYHNCEVGHHGVNRTVESIQAAVANGQVADLPRNLRKHVQWFRSRCPLCQKLEGEKTGRKIAHETIQVTGIFQELSVDMIGPLPLSKSGNQYILVAIDSFARFLFLKACKSTGAEEMARWIVELGGMFGYPKAFRSDNARTFDNHLVQALMQLVGSAHNPSIPYRPQSNGQVERVNKEVIRFLRYLVNDRRVQDDWEPVLPITQRIINSNKSASIGLTPAELLLPGRDLNDNMFPGRLTEPVQAYLRNQVADRKRREAVHEYLSNLIRLQSEAIRAAEEWNKRIVQRRIDSSPTEPREFAEGDWVVHQWRGGRRPSKLATTWRGPYQVVARVTRSMYKLRDPADQLEHDVHIDELYRYNMGLTDDPVDVISMDEAEMLVDAVVDHQCPGKDKSKWTFRVRFVGCGPDEDVWLPFAETNPLSAFDKYLDEHPELGLA